MDAWSCHQYVLPVPEGHPFPMQKYERLHARVAENAARWGVRLRPPPAATDADLERVHCRDYVARMREGRASHDEMRRIGFAWSAQMLERSRRSSGGTIMALRSALDDGVGVNLAGGTHHAAFSRGGGYCVFNDTVVAARHAQAAGWLQRVLVVDLDVHQGDGTAQLCAGDDSIFTFSMHGARNYPAIKPASDLDVALVDGCGDAEYLNELALHLPRALAAARPQAVIYLAGADPFERDRLGRLALTKDGLAERDRRVLEACRSRVLPVAVSMAGGYAPDVDDIVDIHAKTIELASSFSQMIDLEG